MRTVTLGSSVRGAWCVDVAQCSLPVPQQDNQQERKRVAVAMVLDFLCMHASNNHRHTRFVLRGLLS